MDKKSVTPFTKVRRKTWQQEAYKSEKSLGIKNGQQNVSYCGERFIPKRFERENIDFNLKYVGRREEKDILETGITLTSSYWRQSNFISTINSAFHIQERRLLQFSNLQRSRSQMSGMVSIDADWPCLPRSRPTAFQNATHDMAGICSPIDYNMMDWASNDLVAISSGEDVMIWRNLEESTLIFSVESPTALKYSPDGKYLAIGCMDRTYPVLDLWAVTPAMEFIVSYRKYFLKSMGCIRCIEWSHDGNELLCGTNCGIIVVLTRPKMKSQQLEEHRHRISMIKFSPNMRYFASSDTKGTIFIWDASLKKRLVKLGCRSKAVIFDWHPWTGVDLAVVERCPASIFIFNIPHRQFVASYKRKDDRINIKTVTYSKITGELLVNIIRGDPMECLVCEILVLASLNRVVDLLAHQDRGTLFLMWSPDGTNIATGGLDETLSLWSFFPTHKREAVLKRQAQEAKEKCSSLSLFRGIR